MPGLTDEQAAGIARWWQRQVDSLRPGETLIVEARKDRAGHLSRELVVRREGREVWEADPGP